MDFYKSDLRDARPAVKKLVEQDYTVFGWDVEWFDHSTAATMEEKIRKRFKNEETRFPGRCVILLHDKTFYKKKNRDQLISLLIKLKSDYRFARLDEF
jgi:hypothetical protein